MHAKLYNDYSGWVLEKFGARVQKISVDAGFTCPNRDGSKGTGGCIYCDNTTFSPKYCNPKKTISQQLEEGIAFFSKKYPAQKYIAYFQSYTNTYSSLEYLQNVYKEAISYPNIIGLSISTRPDCINEEILLMLMRTCQNHFLSIELGIESTSDKTLALINRCHTFSDSLKAIELLNTHKIHTGAHIILGLPGENNLQIIEGAKTLSGLPIHTLKLHQLQVIKGTQLAEIYKNDPTFIHPLTLDEYIGLTIDFMEYLSPKIIIERFTSESPTDKVIAPNWGGLKNFEIVEKIKKRMIERNGFQGKLTNHLT